MLAAASWAGVVESRDAMDRPGGPLGEAGSAEAMAASPRVASKHLATKADVGVLVQRQAFQWARRTGGPWPVSVGMRDGSPPP